MAAPSRTLLNLNVPNLPTGELRGVRRGRISNAGIVKAAGPRAGGEPLAERGRTPDAPRRGHARARRRQ